MKKFSIAVCVCAVLFSFSNYGECVREVSAQTSGAEENRHAGRGHLFPDYNTQGGRR